MNVNSSIRPAAVFIMLAAGAVSRSQIVIPGSCSDVQTALAGQPGVFAQCSATARCKPVQISANTYEIRDLIDRKKTNAFACPFGTTTHEVSASGPSGAYAMASSTEIISNYSGLVVVQTAASNPCTGAKSGYTIQPFLPARCKKYGGIH